MIGTGIREFLFSSVSCYNPPEHSNEEESMVLDSRTAMSLLPIVMYYLGADTPFRLIVRDNKTSRADVIFGAETFVEARSDLGLTMAQGKAGTHNNTYATPIFDGNKIIGGIAISVNGKENLETVEKFLN